MFFPIKRLPLELALEIIRLAASTDIQANNTQSPVPRYQNARALCLVSHGFREVAMAHLLHTVIFADTESVHTFVRSIRMQMELHEQRSRLALDYLPLVYHVWCTRYLLTSSSAHMAPTPHSILYDIVRNARTVGFTFGAIFFLSEVISGAKVSPWVQVDSKSQLTNPQPAEDWKCKRLTLGGMGIRWNPITSSRQGLAFLAGLTHLRLWSPNIHHSGPAGAVPLWLASVPLENMPNLTHLAFSLNHTEGSTKMDVLVYTCSGPSSHTPSKSGHIFRRWATSADPLEHGTVVQVDIQNVGSVSPIPEHCFELAFLRAAAATNVRS
ncbi:hypothetical protein D9619_001961 [Psilocybe cf. subviscida]|uniref:Uncharacterized protein n=1 Tax=Psilocybe cf. subviscida TaxID=2480587 RepID=A0A8H5F256_9AGAR|nr:hypothetical protein D9619_001961 [Psilocybe cf. subviscida]